MIIFALIFAPLFIASFFWSIDCIVHNRKRKALVTAISCILFFCMMYCVIASCAV